VLRFVGAGRWHRIQPGRSEDGDRSTHVTRRRHEHDWTVRAIGQHAADDQRFVARRLRLRLQDDAIGRYAELEDGVAHGFALGTRADFPAGHAAGHDDSGMSEQSIQADPFQQTERRFPGNHPQLQAPGLKRPAPRPEHDDDGRAPRVFSAKKRMVAVCAPFHQTLGTGRAADGPVEQEDQRDIPPRRAGRAPDDRQDHADGEHDDEKGHRGGSEGRFDDVENGVDHDGVVGYES
jgi:hypothetical protein